MFGSVLDHLPKPVNPHACNRWAVRLTTVSDQLLPYLRMAFHVSKETVSMLGLSDRKSTRLNSSHLGISYAVLCLKKRQQDAHIRLKTAVFIEQIGWVPV